jgi:hypothetical protein
MSDNLGSSYQPVPMAYELVRARLTAGAIRPTRPSSTWCATASPSRVAGWPARGGFC